MWRSLLGSIALALGVSSAEASPSPSQNDDSLNAAKEKLALKGADQNSPSSAADAILRSFSKSVLNSKRADWPYDYWLLADCLPGEAVDQILNLPFEAPSLEGVSGKRELHNNTRKYFDMENRGRFPVCEAVSQAFQGNEVTQLIEKAFGAKLTGTYLRIEFAQDIYGFWLEPHTDLGVKVFTMLLYLSVDPRHRDLGTDIYDTQKRQVRRSPFISNTAMVFIPSDKTFHGFDKRPIEGVRTSLIINYVTDEWRAREQLAFPTQPIA
jgi:hypothetical protein